MSDPVNHPSHYGGGDNPYEAIKVIEAWKLGFNLGNTLKYISRAEKKTNQLEDLKKALWYLDREIKNIEAGDITEVKPHQDDFEEWDKGESRIEQIGQNGGDGRHYVDLQPGQVWEICKRVKNKNYPSHD